MAPPRVLSPLHSAALALALVVAIPTAFPGATACAQQFIRGDVDADGIVELTDVIVLIDTIGTGTPLPAVGSCGGAYPLDTVDVNDNEYLTIADLLRLMDFLFVSGAPIPAPYPSCGPDPTNQSQGFQFTDPATIVQLSGPYDGPSAGGANDPVRAARFPISLQADYPVKAVDLYFGYDPLLLSNPRYVGPLPLGFSSVDYGVANVSLLDPFDPLALSPGLSPIGEIVFDVAPGTGTPSIEWIPVYSSTLVRRATVVGGDFRDHHPTFTEIDAPAFRRGDLNGDAVISVSDLLVFLTLYFGLGGEAIGCEAEAADSDDANDNEFRTVADFLVIRDHLICGGSPIPAPQQCGVDPDDDTDGFEAIDPAYAIRATQFTMIGAGPIERDVEIPIEVLSPEPVRAVAFNLELGTPALTLDTPFFESETGAVVADIANIQEGSRLQVVLATNCGPLVVAGSPEWQPLGTLRLHLAGTTLPNPIEWLPEATIAGVVHRATVVTTDFRDHHPLLLAGEREFQRGNANNGGVIGPVDFADPISLLHYLAGVGPHPSCLDAGDANDDGKLDFADPIYLLHYLSGVLPPMPDPFPECDFERDIDELDCEEYDCF